MASASALPSAARLLRLTRECFACVIISRRERYFISRCRCGRKPGMTQKSELVIIVDDDFRVREAISDLLASRNLASVAFESAAEYLRFGDPNVPSCLVLDLSLPDIDGLELQITIAPAQQPPIVF